jgi:hypothetical protein
LSVVTLFESVRVFVLGHVLHGDQMRVAGGLDCVVDGREVVLVEAK